MRDGPMQVCLITGPALASTHGTGAQILRIFGQSGLLFFHLYWSLLRGRSEINNSHRLEDPLHWPWYKGRRFVSKVERLLGVSWWNGNTVRVNKFRALLKARRLDCDVAYVSVSNEDEAQRAVSLLKHLNCPYVVHIWDICHPGGLDPETMTGYSQLFKGAFASLALNDAIKAQVERFSVSNVEIVSFGQEVTPETANPPAPGQTLRILITGSLYPKGLNLIERCWPSLAKNRQIDLIYVGAHSTAIPESLRPFMTDRGYVSDAEYQDIVRTSHVAYLTGPSELDFLGRFSVPSRLSDFLMAGLPVLACVAAESATEKFLSPLAPSCVHFTRTPEELSRGLDHFSSPKRWRDASDDAKSFALENLAMPAVRKRILDTLTRACARSETEIGLTAEVQQATLRC